jgi:hypothetical protein
MSIQLTRDSVIAVADAVLSRHVWPLQVTAVSATDGLSSKIFVYHAENGDDPYQGDVFECIASLQQMTEIPEDEPSMGEDGNAIPYFRKDSLLFHCRSASEADDLWVKIQADTKDLLQNYLALTGGLTTQETVTITA